MTSSAGTRRALPDALGGSSRGVADGERPGLVEEGFVVPGVEVEEVVAGELEQGYVFGAFVVGHAEEAGLAGVAATVVDGGILFKAKDGVAAGGEFAGKVGADGSESYDDDRVAHVL